MSLGHVELKFKVLTSDCTLPEVQHLGYIAQIKKGNDFLYNAQVIDVVLAGTDVNPARYIITANFWSNDPDDINGDQTCTVHITTKPNLGVWETLTHSWISMSDVECTVETVGSGSATTADVNAAGNAILDVLTGQRPL